MVFTLLRAVDNMSPLCWSWRLRIKFLASEWQRTTRKWWKNSIESNIKWNIEMDFTLQHYNCCLQLKSETSLKFWSGRVATSQDATRFTSIWPVKQKVFCGTRKLSSRWLRSSVWWELNLFYWKQLKFTLMKQARQNHF